MKDDQLTFRLPRELARPLARRARQRRVPKSQLVREVLEAYLTGTLAPDPADAWRRVARMVGALTLDAAAISGQMPPGRSTSPGLRARAP